MAPAVILSFTSNFSRFIANKVRRNWHDYKQNEVASRNPGPLKKHFNKLGLRTFYSVFMVCLQFDICANLFFIFFKI